MANTVGLLGGGYLSGHLAQRLRKDGCNVRVFSRRECPAVPGVHYCRGSIEDQAAVGQWLRGCDELFYLAHDAKISPFRDSDQFALVHNLDLFVRTLATAAAQGVSRILLVSSGGAVYGRTNGNRSWREDDAPAPVSAYGLAKLTMEHYLRMFCAERGTRFLILRPSNPYGPGQTGGHNQGVISIFLRRVLAGQPLEIWGSEAISKDYIYIDDFTAAVSELVRAGYDNLCYNVSSGQPTSLRQIVDAIGDTIGARPEILFRPARANDVPVVLVDPTRLQSRVPWTPQVSLAQGVAATWEWIRRQSPAEPEARGPDCSPTRSTVTLPS